MMFSHTVTTTETPVEVHTVTYRHDYGTDTTVYATKELAYKAACKIISNWIEELEEHESLADLVSLINTGKYVKALVLWSQMIADFDIVEEITVDSAAIETEVTLPSIDFVLLGRDDENEVSDDLEIPEHG